MLYTFLCKGLRIGRQIITTLLQLYRRGGVTCTLNLLYTNKCVQKRLDPLLTSSEGPPTLVCTLFLKSFNYRGVHMGQTIRRSDEVCFHIKNDEKVEGRASGPLQTSWDTFHKTIVLHFDMDMYIVLCIVVIREFREGPVGSQKREAH